MNDPQVPVGCLQVSLYPTSAQQMARAVDALARPLSGLGLDGIGSTLTIMPVDEHGQIVTMYLDDDED